MKMLNTTTAWSKAALAVILSATLGLQAPAVAFATTTEESQQEATQQIQEGEEQQSSEQQADGQQQSDAQAVDGQQANTPQLDKETLAKQREALQQQMEVARTTLANLNTEAELAEYELITVSTQLEATNAHIAELDVKIPETQDRLARAREELKAVIVDNYKTGQPTLLDVFLDVSSFDEIVSRVEYANKISAYQSDVVTEVKDLNSSLVQQRSDLELERVQQEKLVEDQKQRLAAVEAAAASTQQYYNELSVELQETLAAEEEATRAANEAAAEGAAEEAQRLADEMNPDGESDQTQVTGTNSIVPTVGSYRENLPVSPSTNVYSFVAKAFSIIGAGYQWSGYTWVGSIRNSAFTCSGVIDYARGRASRSSSPEILYAEVGSRLTTDVSLLRYGDLVFFTYAGRHPGHVGIYIGGGSMIDSIPNGGVAIRPLDTTNFIGGGPIY